MQKELIFTYPLLYRIVYKFGAIAFNLLMVLYLLSSITQNYTLFTKIYLSVLTLLCFLTFNGFFIGVIKQTPFKISYKDGSLLLSNFFLSRKTIELKLTSISELSGGIIIGKKNKSITATINNGNSFLIFPSIRNHAELLTLLLHGVEKSVYNSTIDKMKNCGLKV